MKYVETVIHICSLGECVSHNLVAWPMKAYTRLYILPCSLNDFNTTSTCVDGVFRSLYRKGLLIHLSIGIRVGVCQNFFSYTIGITWIE
jgi:hypothetical protein